MLTLLIERNVQNQLLNVDAVTGIKESFIPLSLNVMNNQAVVNPPIFNIIDSHTITDPIVFNVINYNSVSDSAIPDVGYNTLNFPVEKFPNKTIKFLRIKKYTLQIFLERSRLIHGTKYDYSKVTEDHIKGSSSRVPLICTDCDYNWSPTINDHINGRHSCPNCQKQAPWTLERFILTATNIHGDNYDYSNISPRDIKGKNSKIPIRCKTCGNIWSPTIDNHINGETECPVCIGHMRWTFEEFILTATEIHENKHDYSRVSKGDIINNRSKITIVCKDCKHVWSPSITNYINKITGCPNCNDHIPWTLERFLKSASNVHGDAHDYSNIINCLEKDDCK